MSIEPIPPELRQLIDAEVPTRVPPEVEARLLSRLDASLDLAFADAPPAPQPTSSPLVKAGAGAALFLSGLVVGAVLHAQFGATYAPQTIVQVTPPPVVAPPPVAEPKPQPELAPPPVPSVVKKTPAPPAPTETSLDRERRLLEPARTALTRGMAPQALSLLEQHAREFPDGSLAEEREALWVQALAVSGSMEAAREKAKAFTNRFPDSLFLPVVERAVRGD